MKFNTYIILLAAIKKLWVSDWICQVSIHDGLLQAMHSVDGHFDGILQDSDWECAGGEAGDPQSEVSVCCGWIQLCIDLLHGRHPGWA